MFKKSFNHIREFRNQLFFLISFIISVCLSEYISIPFFNAYKVSGPLTLIKFNPINNTLRFLFIVFSPSVIYSILFFTRKFLLNKTNKSHQTQNFLDRKTVDPEKESSIKKTEIGGNKVILLGVFILLIFFHLGFGTFVNKPLDTFHEGESLGFAVDYQSDKKPYKDFIFIHGVFQDPLRAVIAFDLFGKSISSNRLMESILNIFVSVLFFVTIFFLFDLQIVYGVFAGSALFLLFDVGYTVPFRDITTYFYIISVSLFYYRFIKRVSFGNSSLIKKECVSFCLLSFLCSFFSVVSFANSIDRGLFSFASIIFFFLMNTLIFHNNKNALRVFFLSSIGGIAAGILVIFVLVKGALLDFFAFTFLKIPLYQDLLYAFVYEFSGRNLIPVILFSAIIFWITRSFLGSVVLDDGVSALDRLKNFISINYLELFLTFLSLVFFKGALGRSDLGHVLYVSAPLFVTLIYIFIKNKIGLNKENGKFFYILTFFLLFLVILNNLFKHDFSEKENWWKFSTNIKDEQLIPENDKQTVEFLKANLKDDEYFVTLTSEASWYYFVNKPCPIKFPSLVLATPNFYQKEIVQQFKNENKKIKYIIYKNNLWTNNFDFISNKKRYPILNKYINENYQFLKLIDDQEIWEIKR